MHTCFTRPSLGMTSKACFFIVLVDGDIWSYVVRTYTCINGSKIIVESHTSLEAAHVGHEKSRRTKKYSSPSSTGTKAYTFKGLVWRLNKSACNSANIYSSQVTEFAPSRCIFTNEKEPRISKGSRLGRSNICRVEKQLVKSHLLNSIINDQYRPYLRYRYRRRLHGTEIATICTTVRPGELP